MTDSTARTDDSCGNGENLDQFSDKDSNLENTKDMGNKICPGEKPTNLSANGNDIEAKSSTITGDNTEVANADEQLNVHGAKHARQDSAKSSTNSEDNTEDAHADEPLNVHGAKHARQDSDQTNEQFDTNMKVLSTQAEALQQHGQDKASEVEFLKWCKENDLSSKIIRLLKSEELNNVKTLKEFQENQINTLLLNSQEQNVLRRALEKLQTGNVITESKKNAEPTLTSYAKAFDQLLNELTLDREVIDTLRNLGVDSPGAFKLLRIEIMKKIQLTPSQIELIEDAIKVLYGVEEDFIMQSRVIKHSQSTSIFTGSKATLNVVARNAIDRFQKMTKDVAKPGICNVATYLQSNEGGTKLDKSCFRNDVWIAKLPVKQVYEEPTNKVRKCILGRLDSNAQQKTIMLVGATGVGKSTLIDGMCNYIFDVKREEKHRFQLIDQHKDEEQNAAVGQTVSQTDWITIYSIHIGESNRLPYTLNVIDTPGFGDSMARDQQLVEQIQFLFKNEEDGITEIDAVCFVAKAPDARLSPSQRYIFTSLMSIFGKNIEVNILVMVTFADAAKAPVIDALKEAELPHTKLLTFNNSALLPNYDISKEFTSKFGQMFWDMSMESFNTFFNCLEELSPKRVCLLSKDSEKRLNFKKGIEEAEENVRTRLSKMAQFEEEEKLFQADLNNIDTTRGRFDKLYGNVEQLQEHVDFAKQNHEINEKAARKCIRKGHTHTLNLREIDHGSETLTELEYIESLLHAEKDGRKDGWRKRVEQLEKIKRKWES